MPTTEPKPRGRRPTLLTQVVRHRTDPATGAQVGVTAGEQIIERRGLGLDDRASADSAGVSRETLHQWRLAGARARAIEAQGRRELTPSEVALRDFVDALERAEAEWEASRLAIIQRSAQGGYVTTKTMEKWMPDPADPTARKLVERTVTTETASPIWQAAAWQLERLRRDKYARRWEVTGEGGKPLIPEADQARGLADSLREYMLGVEDGKKTTAPKGRTKEGTA